MMVTGEDWKMGWNEDDNVLSSVVSNKMEKGDKDVSVDPGGR